MKSVSKYVAFILTEILKLLLAFDSCMQTYLWVLWTNNPVQSAPKNLNDHEILQNSVHAVMLKHN